MTPSLPFAAAFGEELVKLAASFPRKQKRLAPMSVAEAKRLTPDKKPGLSTARRLVQRPKAKAPGMFYNPPKGRKLLQSPKPKSSHSVKVKFRKNSKPGALPGVTAGGGRWNVSNPTQRHSSKLRAARARRRPVRGTDISEETTIAGA